MNNCTFDKAQFYKSSKEGANAIYTTYVDDALYSESDIVQ